MQGGVVYLVGAGPGDPDLITVRGKALITSCDALVYDYLVNPSLLDWTAEGCDQICVGKRPGFHSRSQEEIANLLVRLAREGRSVVRLKGGDPFVFGRGGEEAAHLREQNIRYEVVPAVTAALASAAYSGIPLTHRGHSSALVFLSGHEDPDKGTGGIDWRAYARLPATLCLYMAMGRLERIVAELQAGGMAPGTPVAVVQWATTPRQRTCLTTVESVAAEVERLGFGPPAVVIIGPVAQYAETLGWFEER